VVTKEGFLSQVEAMAMSMAAASPVSAAVMRFISDELRRGDPPWWQKTQKLWEKRDGPAHAWNLVLAGMHFEALNDAKNPLVRYFPSCGGTPEADPAPAIKAFLADAPVSFYEHLKSAEVRSYDKFLASFWNGPAQLFFAERELPYYLVEVNSGGGLNLVADSGAEDFDHDLVAARIGLDSRPLLMEDIGDRRWMTACIAPEDELGIANVDAAIELVLEGRRRDPNFIQLVKCPVDKAPRFIAKNIPLDDGGVGLLLINVKTTSFMEGASAAAFSRDMLEMMRPWGDRALWAECEFLPNELSPLTLQWRAHRVVAGLFQTAQLGRFELATNKQSLELEQTRPFFAV
jgi:hypothetical protein